MPQYIRLVTMTEQAVRNVTELAEMLAQANQVWAAHGCRIVQAWSTLGPYDAMAVIEGPDDATVMKASALVARAGNFRAMTLPAVPMSEFTGSLKKA